MILSDIQLRRFQDYSRIHTLIFSDRIIQDFFKNEANIALLLKTLDGNDEAQRELDERFRKHFFRIRFIKYLVSTIHYCMIDQMRSYHKYAHREQYILDRPVSDDVERATLGETLLSSQDIPPNDPDTPDPAAFEAVMQNEQLSNAFVQLSSKQRTVITLSYALSMKDREIAIMMGITPQAVSKTRNLALHKLRQAMAGRGESVG